MKKQEIHLANNDTRQRLIEFFANLNLEKPWTVTIAPFRQKRTLSQNALMWKWLNEVAEAAADYTGFSADELHDYFKGRFCPVKEVTIAGVTVERRSTANLTVDEMSEYMTRVHAFVTTELGLYLTLPEERHAA